MHHRMIIPALVLSLAVVSACGSDDETSGGAASTVASAAGASSATASLNEQEVEFAQGMIAHHEQAIEMSEIALDPTRGARAEVVDLATRIQAAQDPEIGLMTGRLTAAGESITMDTSDGHDMSEMEGMMSVEDMDALAAATGGDFDVMWLEMMIAHHEGAISQAETVKADAANPDVIALADQIIATQQAEIAEMKALLAS